MALVNLEISPSRIGRITFNDPDNLNAMGEAMAQEFSALVAGLKLDPQGLRAIILTGAGRAFSAGGNLKMLQEKQKLGGEENRLRMLKFYDSFLGILDLKVPLIAAINGHAIGAGLCLASACDIRIAAKGAKLGFTFTRLGLHPGMGATYFLPRAIGYGLAMELLLTGRVVEAEEALRFNLVSKIVEPGTVLAEAERIASEIGECGPLATQQLLESLRNGPLALSASLEREALCQSINYANKEFAEGVAATIEKRKPNY